MQQPYNLVPTDMELESPRTFLSVDAVASSEGTAGLKLSEQAAASCADSRHSGALPAQHGEHMQSLRALPAQAGSRCCAGCM